MLKIKAAVYSDTGQVRQTNEDNLYWQGQYRKAFELAGTLNRTFSDQSSVQLYAISDGMGGLARGEVASRIAVSGLAELDDRLKAGLPEDDIKEIDSYLKDRNDYIWERNKLSDSLDDAMGATISLLLLRDDEAILVNMGDTAVFHCHDGLMKQIFRDDSHAARLRSLGYLTSEEASRHPYKNALINFLGKEAPEGELRYFLVPDIHLSAGDLILLCSDGISGVLRRDSIHQVLEEDLDVQEKVELLVDLSVASGSSDNITAVLLEIVETASDRTEARRERERLTPIEAADIEAFESNRSELADLPEGRADIPAADETKRIPVKDMTSVYRPVLRTEWEETGSLAEKPLKPIRPERVSPRPVKPAAEAPSAESRSSDPEVSAEGPVRPVKAPEGLTPAQLAYYNRAREESLKRQAEKRKERALMEEEKYFTAEREPISGHYSRPENQPVQTYEAGGAAPQQGQPADSYETFSMNQAAAPSGGFYPAQGSALPQQGPPLRPNPPTEVYGAGPARVLTREEKQRLYDRRYQDSGVSEVPNQRSYKQEKRAERRGGMFSALLSWCLFFMIFVLLGFGLSYLLIYILPKFL